MSGIIATESRRDRSCFEAVRWTTPEFHLAKFLTNDPIIPAGRQAAETPIVEREVRVTDSRFEVTGQKWKGGQTGRQKKGQLHGAAETLWPPGRPNDVSSLINAFSRIPRLAQIKGETGGG